MTTVVQKLIEAAGGRAPLARLIGVKRERIWHWEKPRKSGIPAGSIPQRHHKRILELAAKHRWPINASDLASV